jgi:hypothetical protein
VLNRLPLYLFLFSILTFVDHLSYGQSNFFGRNKILIDTVQNLSGNDNLPEKTVSILHQEIEKLGLQARSDDFSDTKILVLQRIPNLFYLSVRLLEYQVAPVFTRTETGGQQQEGFEGHLIADFILKNQNRLVVDSFRIDTRSLEGLKIPGLSIKLFRPVYATQAEAEEIIYANFRKVTNSILRNSLASGFPVVQGSVISKSYKEFAIFVRNGVEIKDGELFHLYTFDNNGQMVYLGPAESDIDEEDSFFIELKTKKSTKTEEIKRLLKDNSIVFATLVKYS